MTGEKAGLEVPVTASPLPLSVVWGKGEAVVVTTWSTLNGPLTPSCWRLSCWNCSGALVGQVPMAGRAAIGSDLFGSARGGSKNP